jgi:hypothetical protein
MIIKNVLMVLLFTLFLNANAQIMPPLIKSNENITACVQGLFLEKALIMLQNKGLLPCLYGYSPAATSNNGNVTSSGQVFYFCLGKPKVDFQLSKIMEITFPVIIMNDPSKNDLKEWTTGDIACNLVMQYSLDVITLPPNNDGIRFLINKNSFRIIDVPGSSITDDQKDILRNDYEAFVGWLFKGNLDVVDLSSNTASHSNEIKNFYKKDKQFEAQKLFKMSLKPTVDPGIATYPDENRIQYGSNIEYTVQPQ